VQKSTTSQVHMSPCKATPFQIPWLLTGPACLFMARNGHAAMVASGPLSERQGGKHLLAASISAFDPRTEMDAVRRRQWVSPSGLHFEEARFQRGHTRFRDQVSSRRGRDCSYWCHPLGVASPANDTHTQLAPSEEIQYAENSYDPGLQPGRLSLFLQCPSTGLLRTRLSPWPLWCLRAQRCADSLGRDAR